MDFALKVTAGMVTRETDTADDAASNTDEGSAEGVPGH